MILKATSFLEGHKRDMGMTFMITRFIAKGSLRRALMLLLCPSSLRNLGRWRLSITVLLVYWVVCTKLFLGSRRTCWSQYWERLFQVHRMHLSEVDKFWILSWWLMNVWIVGLDMRNLECCVNWIWKGHVVMLIRSFYYICCRDVVLERDGETR